jgi:hypothetical protein
MCFNNLASEYEENLQGSSRKNPPPIRSDTFEPLDKSKFKVNVKKEVKQSGSIHSFPYPGTVGSISAALSRALKRDS